MFELREGLSTAEMRGPRINRIGPLPGQVLRPSEIVAGGRYARVMIGDEGIGSDMSFTVVKPPYGTLKYGFAELWMDVDVNTRVVELNYGLSLCLADCGITPYQNGIWHGSAYTVRIGDNVNSAKQVNE